MAEQKFYIQNSIHIKDNCIFYNGKRIFYTEEKKFSGFLKNAYHEFGTTYPKFFKMDQLSKLAFLGSDLLLKDLLIDKNTALVFSNRASSLDTDRKHQRTIEDAQNFFPSPAVFVYTLPNICLGEISIRHKLHSENSFFIFNRFNANHLYINATALLNAEKATSVLCGWVDVDEDKYEGFIYLVSQKGNTIHTIKNIEKLYNSQ